MNKLTVAILALALTGSVAFAQGQGGGRGGNRGGGQGGGRGNRGGQAGQVQPGGAGGAGGMMGGQGGFGGQGGMMGGQGGGRGNRGGQQGGGRGNRGGGQGGMGQGGFGQGMGQGGFGQGGMGQGGFGQGGMGQGGFGQGGFGQGGFGQGGMGPGMGQGGFGQGMGQGGMMGAPRNGQLQQTIDRLTAETPREQALKKLEAKDKEAYNKIQKDLADANAKLLELAKKAEIELPETAEQQKAKTLEFLAKEKDAIDKLLETDKTDSASAMRDFTELAQKNQITLTPAGGRDALAGQAGRRTQPGAGGANSSAIRQIQEKFPEEYNEAQKLRDTDPTGYRTRMRELQQKLNAAN